jgi:hypothetical protein
VREHTILVEDPFRLAIAEGPRPARSAYLVVVGDDTLYAIQAAFVVGRSEPSVRILDRDFQVNEELEVTAWSRTLFSVPRHPVFIRGDVTEDGALDLADAISLLTFLFRSGPAPSCADAADATDDGTVTVSDAVTLLRHLYVTPTLPASCGFDETEDTLDSCDYAPWPCID